NQQGSKQTQRREGLWEIRRLQEQIKEENGAHAEKDGGDVESHNACSQTQAQDGRQLRRIKGVQVPRDDVQLQECEVEYAHDREDGRLHHSKHQSLQRQLVVDRLDGSIQGCRQEDGTQGTDQEARQTNPIQRLGRDNLVGGLDRAAGDLKTADDEQTHQIREVHQQVHEPR